jgi:hypothetical protein
MEVGDVFLHNVRAVGADLLEMGRDFMHDHSIRPQSTKENHENFVSPIPHSEIEISPSLLRVVQPTAPSVPPTGERHRKILNRLQKLQKMLSIETCEASLGSVSLGIDSSHSFDKKTSKENFELLSHLKLQNCLSDILSFLLNKPFKSNQTLDLLHPNSPINHFIIDCTSDPFIQCNATFSYLPLPDTSYLFSSDNNFHADLMTISAHLCFTLANTTFNFQPIPFTSSPNWRHSFLFLIEHICTQFDFETPTEDSIVIRLQDITTKTGDYIQWGLRDAREMLCGCRGQNSGVQLAVEDSILFNVEVIFLFFSFLFFFL